MVLAVLPLLIAALPALADHGKRPHTDNLIARGHSSHPADFGVPAAERQVNSDIAFWGNIAFNGNYNGFRVIDFSDSNNPEELSHPDCNGDQGDIVVWGDYLVRSWNSPAPEGRTCGGEPVPVGFEGLHVFDISDLRNPQLIGQLELSDRPEADAFGCGSHTATGVPDLANNRLIIYNSTSGGPCPFVGVLELDLATGELTHLRDEPREGPSHDVGVILGDADLMVSAGHDLAHVWDISSSLEDPEFLYTIAEEGVGEGGNWHSAALTWDGEVIILGWEPGGGGQAECEAGDPDVKKSAFFYDADDGTKLGQWTLPRDQGPDENCTIHNYNIVPMSGKYLMVGGHYQAGTWVVDFTDPANAQTVAWSDPPSLGPGPFCSATSPPGCQLGGAWSSYYYKRGFIYESDITRGLLLFRLRDRILEGALELDHLNPQTQEFSLP